MEPCLYPTVHVDYGALPEEADRLAAKDERDVGNKIKKLPKNCSAELKHPLRYGEVGILEILAFINQFTKHSYHIRP